MPKGIKVTLMNGEKVLFVLESTALCSFKEQNFVRIGERFIVGVIDNPFPRRPRSANIFIYHEVDGVYRYFRTITCEERGDGSVSVA